MTFHFADHVAEGVDIIDAESILLSAKKICLGTDSLKINQRMYKKSRPVKASIFSSEVVF